MSSDNNKQFISAKDLLFAGILKDIKKSKTALQPVYEAFTNALEAIKIKQEENANHIGKILININANPTLFDDAREFHSLSIEDNGIGFNNIEFDRFNTYKDTRKGYNNLGSGRIQYVHFFNSTIIDSTYCENGNFFDRKMELSKCEAFLSHNAIVKHKVNNPSQDKETGTKITFTNVMANHATYHELTHTKLKDSLIKRYILYFCHNRDSLPNIQIQYSVNDELVGSTSIEQTDIPDVDKTEHAEINYVIAKNRGKYEVLDETESFTINAFKINSNTLSENSMSLVSKSEIVLMDEIVLRSLTKDETISGNRYLFLVSSSYITQCDTNVRGELNLFSKQNPNLGVFDEGKQIFIEDINSQINSKINGMYPEILETQSTHEENFRKLKDMFLLDDKTESEIDVSVNDSEKDILKKFYEAEAQKVAQVDAEIKTAVDTLDDLDSTAPNYQEQLIKSVESVTKKIPLQNQRALTHYVARRKLVLDLLDKILKKELQVQINESRNKDEALIHNLLFTQNSGEPNASDLWILNEEFIYFQGSSDTPLNLVKIDGKKLFKDSFTQEENEYLMSLGENRKIKKPDVLLFPQEGKCIIIEFKAPDVNASEHLTQINKYAGLIRNHSNNEFQIKTFYGYLIGESIEHKDVLGAVSSFEYDANFDYLYEPAKKVIGFDGRDNGSIYTEVIKYSTLLERAKLRNKVFIDKLTQDN